MEYPRRGYSRRVRLGALSFRSQPNHASHSNPIFRRVDRKDDSVLPPGADPSAYRYAISADSIETMGITLERGRTIDERDRAGGQPVALISVSVAKRRFPGRDPIGQPLRFGPPDNWFTVVGVVGDANSRRLRPLRPMPSMYRKRSGVFPIA